MSEAWENARKKQREKENDPEHTQESIEVIRDGMVDYRTGIEYRRWLERRLRKLKIVPGESKVIP